MDGESVVMTVRKRSLIRQRYWHSRLGQEWHTVLEQQKSTQKKTNIRLIEINE